MRVSLCVREIESVRKIEREIVSVREIVCESGFKCDIECVRGIV